MEENNFFSQTGEIKFLGHPVIFLKATTASRKDLYESLWFYQHNPYTLLTVKSTLNTVPCDWMLVPLVEYLWSKHVITRGWEQGGRMEKYSEITFEKNENGDYKYIRSLFPKIIVEELDLPDKSPGWRREGAKLWANKFPDKIFWSEFKNFNRLIVSHSLLPKLTPNVIYNYKVFLPF